MTIQQFLSPRIRLTKTDGSRAIIPIDAISGIEEDKRGKCVRVNTIDGFSYDVVNSIVDIDKKIDESIARVNGAVPIVLPDNSNLQIPVSDIPGKVAIYENAKSTRFKKKRMLSAGIDKPASRMSTIAQREGTDMSIASTAPADAKKSDQTTYEEDTSEDSEIR